jgi:hypothetical protein
MVHIDTQQGSPPSSQPSTVNDAAGASEMQERGHTPTPWRLCNEGECPCLMIWCPDHPIAKVESGEWGDEYPAMRQIGAWLENKYEAYMERIDYGHIYPDVAKANALLIVKAVNGYDAMVARIARLESDLNECAEFLEGQADVVDGSYGEPSPNRAMRLLSMIDETLHGLPY